MIELVRAGRMPERLAEDYAPSAQTIANWVNQATSTTAAASGP